MAVKRLGKSGLALTRKEKKLDQEGQSATIAAGGLYPLNIASC